MSQVYDVTGKIVELQETIALVEKRKHDEEQCRLARERKTEQNRMQDQQSRPMETNGGYAPGQVGAMEKPNNFDVLSDYEMGNAPNNARLQQQAVTVIDALEKKLLEAASGSLQYDFIKGLSSIACPSSIDLYHIRNILCGRTQIGAWDMRLKIAASKLSILTPRDDGLAFVREVSDMIRESSKKGYLADLKKNGVLQPQTIDYALAAFTNYCQAA